MSITNPAGANVEFNDSTGSAIIIITNPIM